MSGLLDKLIYLNENILLNSRILLAIACNYLHIGLIISSFKLQLSKFNVSKSYLSKFKIIFSTIHSNKLLSEIEQSFIVNNFKVN